MEFPRVHKIMGNREVPHGMEVISERIAQPSSERTWGELQKLAEVPHMLGELFAVEGEDSKSEGQAERSFPLPSKCSQAATVDFVNDAFAC